MSAYDQQLANEVLSESNVKKIIPAQVLKQSHRESEKYFFVRTVKTDMLMKTSQA